MILGLAQNQLVADHSVIQHLNNCTGCGACEAVCPSRVPYMQLIDDSKYLLRSKNKAGLSLTMLLWMVRHPGRYGWLKKLLSSQRLGKLLRSIRLLDASTALIQKQVSSSRNRHIFDPVYHAQGEVKGDIALFTGCITQLFDQTTLLDSITLLNHCGYNVHVPAQQVCCGALHQHNGEPDVSQQLLQQNHSTFDSKRFDAIIGSSTGCVKQLQSLDTDRPVIDIMQFIQQQDLISSLPLQPLKQRVSVHRPCTQQSKDIEELLKAIPELQTQSLNTNNLCCGAGGSQLIKPTTSSQQLQQMKCDDILQQQPDILITTNYGCALHIASGLNQDLSENNQIEIYHPVSLLVKSASLK